MSHFTHEETLTIIEQSQAARAAGNYEEGMRIAKRLPIAPHLAKAAKEIWGKKFLVEGGYDLSEAEVAYGKDWLDR